MYSWPLEGPTGICDFCQWLCEAILLAISATKVLRERKGKRQIIKKAPRSHSHIATGQIHPTCSVRRMVFTNPGLPMAISAGRGGISSLHYITSRANFMALPAIKLYAMYADFL